MADPQVTALAALKEGLDDAMDVGIYPAASPSGPRTPYQDGWNAAAMTIGDAFDAAWERLAAGVRVGDDELRAALGAVMLADHPAMLSGSVDHGSRSFPCKCAVHEDARAALDRPAATPAGIDVEQGIVQRAHVPCCWCGEHHEEGL